MSSVTPLPRIQTHTHTWGHILTGKHLDIRNTYRHILNTLADILTNKNTHDTNAPWQIHKGIHTHTHTPIKDIHSQIHIQRDSHILRHSAHTQGHSRPQTLMFPDKPPPTSICTPQHRHPHLHTHFLIGTVPQGLPPCHTTPRSIIQFTLPAF